MWFNAIMLVLDVGVLAILSRFRKIGVGVFLGVLVTVVGTIVGVCLAQSRFHLVRMAAYGMFLHAPILLVGAAFLWRKSSKIVMGGLAALAAILLGTAGYAFLVEPFWLDVTRYEIVSPKISRPFRIVIVADLQTSQFGNYEKRVLKEALNQKPDLILFAGDYLQAPPGQCSEQTQAINAFLKEIDFSAQQGVYAVRGNVDPGHWKELFQDREVIAVDRREHFEKDDFQLTCLELGESFSLRTRVENPDPQKFHIVLGHVPNYAKGEIVADLLVAGHTHGGQVRFPFFGPLTINALVPRSWGAGLTKLPQGGMLLVPRGIGMERGDAPWIRFLCRPELAVVDVVPEPGSSRPEKP